MTNQTTAPPDVSLPDALRALADFYDAHPDLPQPHAVPVCVFSLGDDEKATLAAFARAFGRSMKETSGLDDELLKLVRDFGAGVTLEAVAWRKNVCERVVTATREVVKEIPDPDALAAVPKVTVTETVEDVEWVCRPLLAAKADEPVTA